MAEYVQQHRDLEHSLPSDVLAKWGMEVEAWEANPSLSNPFEQVIISKHSIYYTVGNSLTRFELPPKQWYAVNCPNKRDS